MESDEVAKLCHEVASTSYDLHTDPKQETPLNSQWYHNGWIRWPAGEHLVRHIASFQKEPPIRPGTPDPYEPGSR